MGTLAAETVAMPAAPTMTVEEARARHDALRAEVRRVQELRGCTMTEIAREAGISYGTFSQWVGGIYKGRVGTYDDQVERWLHNLDRAKRASSVLPAAPAFIMTPAAAAFFAAFEHAQHAPDLAVVSGAAGVGKTSAIMAYRAQAANVWVITGEPCISTPRMVLDEVADMLGSSGGRSTHRISRAIVERMRGTRGLLIVDEAQHLNTPTLDQLRTIHDLAGVGVVLAGNERISNRIEGGARTPEFAQLFSRVGMRVPRPKAVKGDIEALLDAWNIEGPAERRLLATIARKPGALRSMTKVLRIAVMQARAANEPISARFIEMGWEHLTAQKLDVDA